MTWTHEYVGSLRADGFTIDTARVDDGLVLGGRNTINTDDWNGCIIKVDQFGSEQWRRYLGGPFRDGRANVIATTDSAYVSVGAYAGYQSTVSTSSRLYAAKLDMGGGLAWEREYGSLGPVNELSSVTELSNGDFLAAGLYSVVGGDKGVLLKFTTNGDSVWMRTYRHPPLDSMFSTHWLYHAVEDADGSIVAAGMCTDGQQDLWVIRVDSLGCLVPGCEQFDHIAEQPAEPGASPLNVLLYPNPASDRVYLSFRSGKPPTGEFRMFDAAGKLVRRFEPGGKSMEIDLNVGMHPPGLYILNYTDKRGERWSERLIIE